MAESPQDLIDQIEQNHAVPRDDIEEMYEEKLEQVQERGLKGDQAEARAMKMLWTSFKRRSQSSSVKIEGVIIGAGDRYDAVAYSREQAIDAYKDNPQGAIKDAKVAVACPPEEASQITGNGVTIVGEKNGWAIVSFEGNEKILQYDFAERDPETGSVSGTDDGDPTVEEDWRLYPLDDRERFRSGDRNDDYGMPTEKHQWTRRGIGVFKSDAADEDGLFTGHLTLRGSVSAQNPPLYEPIQFEARLSPNDDVDGEYYINSTSDTEFEYNEELDNNMSKTVDEIIESHFGGTDYLHDLASVYEYMQDASDRERRNVIVKSDVISMDMDATSNNTYRFVIGEMEFHGGEMVELEATCWVPTWLDPYIDFAVDSRIYVVGRANLTDAYDPETGTTTSEEKEVVINTQGLFAIPELKIPREDAQDIDEEDLDYEPEEEDPGFEGGDDW